MCKAVKKSITFNTHARMHASTHAHTHTYKQLHTHTHTHTHTQQHTHNKHEDTFTLSSDYILPLYLYIKEYEKCSVNWYGNTKQYRNKYSRDI